MLNLIPYALAAYGGYKGYKDSKDQGISGINRLLNTATGAALGYTAGQYFPGVKASIGTPGGFVPFTQTGFAQSIGLGAPAAGATGARVSGITQGANPKFLGADRAGNMIANPNYIAPKAKGGTLLDILKKKGTDEYDPLKVGGSLAALTFLGGAFDQGPTDIYTPGYNMSYLELQKQRPGFTYIDPTTGEEKAYEKVYAPEEQGLGDPRVGAYSMDKTRLRTGGLAEIRKFNEGGINYLPSKTTHDENDANNYVRASGYVEDGAGVGDKDEDTMLAQLADGEFVTRADGVLGAGIIAGANPNSMRDMREKGAKYFYEQQARYKRVFDLLKEKNGESKQKTN